MKFVNGKIGLTLRLGAMLAALLSAQQAMAIGTAAGTVIDNTVTVDYEVNNVNQTDLNASVSFWVDRRVDFDLAPVGGALVDIAPEQTGAFFDFLLTNDSNSALDFNIDLQQMVGGLVRGVADDGTMQTVDYAVSANSVANGDPDPVRTTGPQFVDELAADDSIRIRVFGDAALAMLNGEVAGVELEATAAEPGNAGTEGTALVDTTDGDLQIDNVFAEDAGGGDGIQLSYDGWIVVAADLTVSKAYSVIAGDFGTGQPIPGATVQYVITVVNGSASSADAVKIDDVIDEDIQLVLNAYGGNDIDVDLEGATLPCDIEINGDGDGCDFDAGTRTITVGAADYVPTIIIDADETLTLTYQVTIPNPDPTP